MLGLAVDGVLNQSLVPLRIASAVGLLVGSFTLVLMFVYLAGRLIFGQDWPAGFATRSEEHTSELPSLMRNPYAVFCLTKQKHAFRIPPSALKNQNKKYNAKPHTTTLIHTY